MEEESQRSRMREVARRSLSLAREYAIDNAWGRCVAHYFVVLGICPDFAETLEQEFANALQRWTTQLVAENKRREFFLCCEQALSAYPASCRVLYELGRHLITLDSHMQACGFLQKALLSNAGFAPAETLLNMAKSILVSRWHYRMLNDKRRNLTYRRAIHEIVTSQDLVLDVGCGSGLLSLYAAEKQAGVIACDNNEAMISIATNVLKRNNAKVHLVGKYSKDIALNEIGGVKLSVIVTEIFDAGLFGEGALETLADAWERLLLPSPGGRVIPHSAILYMCGVQSETLARKFRVIYSNQNKLFTHINFKNMNIFNDSQEPYDTEDLSLIQDIKYVTEPQEIFRVDFQNYDELKNILENVIENVVVFKTTEKCKIDAYAMWFDLNLTESVTLTTDPRNLKRCTAWDTAVFHRTFPLKCEKDANTMIKVQLKKGLICVLYDKIDDRVDFPVSQEIVRFLNDSDYIDKMISAVSFACLHSVQLFTFEHIKVLDSCCFPVIGLLLLVRGIRTLCCSVGAYQILNKLSEFNNINMKSIKFIKDVTYNSIRNDRYEIVASNYIDLSGSINFNGLLISEIVKTHKLRYGGMSMPSNLRMVGRLINSKYLNNFNRINDHNLMDSDETRTSEREKFKPDNETLDNFDIKPSGEGSSQFILNKTENNVHKSSTYKIADIINGYQLSHNTHHASVSFDKTFLTDEFTIFEECSPDTTSKTVNVFVTEDGMIDAIQVYHQIELIPDAEETSTDRNNSFVNNSYFLIDPPILVKQGDKISVLVFCNTLEHLKMMVVHGVDARNDI